MTTAVASQAPPRPGVTRLRGVDAARGIALLAMMVTHLVPQFGSGGGAEPAFAAADGRASALFAVVAGMSLALGDGGAARATPRPYGVMLLRIAVRAVLVAILGLLLGAAGAPILVILVYYALLFVLVAPLLRLPAAALAGLAAAWAIAGPAVSHALRSRSALLGDQAQPTIDRLVGDPGGLAVQLLLTGTYPAGTWLAYALAGAALGRVAWTHSRAAVAAGGGLGLALLAHGVSAALLALPDATVAGTIQATTRFYGTTPTGTWWWLALDHPHSGTPLDLLATIGSAVVVIGLMLLLLSSPVAPGFRWLAATGSMTLTLYTAHVLAAAAGLPAGQGPWATWVTHAAVAVAIAALWRWRFRRGPLEAVLATAGRIVRPAPPPAT